MEQFKKDYLKLVTANYNLINKTNEGYCLICFKDTISDNQTKDDFLINSLRMSWISDKEGLTAQCEKCGIDAVIPTAHLKDKSENEIKEILLYLSKEFF
tara:strand:+ start:1856 stop:2152 length:297 start_codon:yes stop_codon:yes gene_type:complete